MVRRGSGGFGRFPFAIKCPDSFESEFWTYREFVLWPSSTPESRYKFVDITKELNTANTVDAVAIPQGKPEGWSAKDATFDEMCEALANAQNVNTPPKSKWRAEFNAAQTSEDGPTEAELAPEPHRILPG